MAGKNNAQKLFDLIGKFVTKNEGAWDHAGWEEFLADVEKLGLPLDDEMRRNLGNCLEAGKVFYHAAPVKKTARPKARPKAKAEAKESKPKK
jgi:hypothetical protein